MTIREIKPRPGDRVKAKDVLIVLDDRELNAQQREATASLVAAEADLVSRSSNYERIKALKSAVSSQEFSNVESWTWRTSSDTSG